MNARIPLTRGWNFRRVEPSPTAWAEVELPHTPFVSDLDGRTHWFGDCEYQRTVALPAHVDGGRCLLHVGAAMHSAIVEIDGVEVGRHAGGYLPFAIDLTSALADRQLHTLTLRLDNRDNADVPPGKPYADLDFCWYGGLYRDVELRCYPPVHITDPIGAGAVASGGIFVRTLSATPAAAQLSVQVHIANTTTTALDVDVTVEITHAGRIVAHSPPTRRAIAAQDSANVLTEISIAQPALWSIAAPALHHARVTVRSPAGDVLDVQSERFGIRRINFSRSGGFILNGERVRLRGTNRHQELPGVGYALPASAQRRDVRLIKEAGFDYVRLSHYPQSPDFLAACDELGVVVMNCIPGWQFMGGERFRAACEQNTRDLVRRDRNHPCVVLWELSLNETAMDEAFMGRMQRAGHEEYPGDQFFTCGWKDHYDVYIHSRQHGQIHRWQNGDKALVVAEYGDWEFFASNHGFDQKTGAGVYADWSHARQRRIHGERGLRQQLENHLIALNDTLGSPAVLDGQWSMFDYARGYAPERAACGVMDIFRLPKFSFFFYRSQRDPQEGGDGWKVGPMVYIASHWTAASDLRLLVLSNCDEVELCSNGRSLGRQAPAKAWHTQYLPHPPFAFDVASFEPGELRATGFIGSHAVAFHRIATPGTAAQLALKLATEGIFPDAEEPDVLPAHASILDSNGTVCVNDVSAVEFTIDGQAEIVGPSRVIAEAGIASVIVRVPRNCATFSLQAFHRDTGSRQRVEWRRPDSEPASRIA